MEEIKRRAKEARIAARLSAGEDEEEEEEEEEEPQSPDETGADGAIDKSGVGHEMRLIADFQCYDIPQFTTKVMQGVANKSLLAMNSHKRKTAAQEAEDLFLLDEI